MRFSNYRGRAHLVVDDRCYDLERASAGRFSADPQAAFSEWERLRDWATSIEWGRPPTEGVLVEPGLVGPPAPRPRQVFAVGLNYHTHAAEANLAVPPSPVIFTKFPSCLAGAYADIALPSMSIDWEIELVVTIGRLATAVPEGRAWAHVAGLSVGQDITDRVVQHSPPVPQFSMGKSFPDFGPFGPAIVSLDEVPQPDDIELVCHINGDEVQRARTSDLIFTVPQIVAYLSSIVTLYPGDVVFTGTPAGVGGARSPLWFLRAGDVIESAAGGVGSMINRCSPVADRTPAGVADVAGAS